MNIESISIITGIIKREKHTSNLIFSLKLKGHELEPASLKHSDSIYSLMKNLSTLGFNMELSEPELLDLNDTNIVPQCLDDITFYLKYINGGNDRIAQILISLTEIKIDLLKLLHTFSSNQSTPDLGVLA